MKVKSNFRKYSRAEGICQSREILTLWTRTACCPLHSTRNLLPFPCLLLSFLQPQTELNLFFLNLLLDFLLLLLILRPSEGFPQPGNFLQQLHFWRTHSSI